VTFEQVTPQFWQRKADKIKEKERKKAKRREEN
jgi:hypothetical protein